MPRLMKNLKIQISFINTITGKSQIHSRTFTKKPLLYCVIHYNNYYKVTSVLFTILEVIDK